MGLLAWASPNCPPLPRKIPVPEGGVLARNPSWSHDLSVFSLTPEAALSCSCDQRYSLKVKIRSRRKHGGWAGDLQQGQPGTAVVNLGMALIT